MVRNRKSAIGNRQSKKSWQHRIGSGPADPVAEAFVESLSFDHRLLPYDIQGSIAHATMLAKVKLITAKDLAAIKRGLLAILKDYQAGKLTLDPAYEDIHMVVEAELIRRIGEPGRRLHTARSRNDQVALDIRLWMDDQCDILAYEALGNLMEELYKCAERHLSICMPAYTHLQQAQAICGAAPFLAFAEALDRSQTLLFDLSLELGHYPIGSGAVAGTTLPIRRDISSGLHRGHRYEQFSLFDFSLPRISADDKKDPYTWLTNNSMDATGTRDAVSTFIFFCAQTMVTLSRMAEDFILWMTQEFGYLEMGDAYTTGSSMMPQKRNPDMLELIRGKAALVIGNVTQILTLQKGLPMAYNRDLQEDKRILFAAYDQTAASLEMMTRMVRTVRLNQAAINRHIDKGFIDATALSEYFVLQGIPFRTAHQIVGALVRGCVTGPKGDGGQPPRLKDLPLEAFQKACREAGVVEKIIRKLDRTLYGWLGPENVVRKYQSYGSAGIDSCKQQIQTWQERFQKIHSSERQK